MGDLAASVRLIVAGWVLLRHDALAPREIAHLLPPPVRLAAGALRLLAGPQARQGRPGERLAAAFEKLGPAAIKLGQLLSTRAGSPPKKARTARSRTGRAASRSASSSVVMVSLTQRAWGVEVMGNFSTANNAGAPGDRDTSHPTQSRWASVVRQLTGAATENHPIHRRVGWCIRSTRLRREVAPSLVATQRNRSSR